LAGETPGTRIQAPEQRMTGEQHMPKGQIKDEKTYRRLRKHGESKEKSARIANAAAGSSRKKVAAKGGRSRSYDDWSKADLLKRAKEIGIKGRSAMRKSQLVAALRGH
jgi:Rho termination factor, N-terminal domain